MAGIELLVGRVMEITNTKGLFINDVIHFGGVPDPHPLLNHPESSFGLLPPTPPKDDVIYEQLPRIYVCIS